MKCSRCSRDAQENYTLCKVCRDSRNAYFAKRYRRLQRLRICTKCRKTRARAGQTRCNGCAIADSKRVSTWSRKKIRLTPEEYAKWREERYVKRHAYARRLIAENRCNKCAKPKDREGWLCLKCTKRFADYCYKKRGKFGLRKSDIDAKHKRKVIANTKQQLGEGWNEVKGWVEDNWKLFVDTSDTPLFMSRELMPNEDFVDESLGG